MNYIAGANFLDSKVMAKQGKRSRQNLLHLLKGVTGDKLWYKCYRASENRFSSYRFHSACDNKGPTVTLVRVGSKVFGGYTDKSWNGKHMSFCRNSFPYCLILS